MLTIGVDAHKTLHVAVAVDEAGRVVGQWQGATSPEGWDAVTEWARALGESRRWGIEGTGSYGQGLARHLVARGEVVYEVNARLTAAGRRGARRPGKSDALDAAAIARAVLREGDALPRVQPADEAAILDLLVTEREAAQAEATRPRNQVHALLHQLDPHYRRRIPSLITAAGLAALEQYQAASRHPLDHERAASVRRLGRRLRLAVEQAAELARQIEERAKARFSPLTEVYGVKGLTAGALAGILGQRRFASEAQLAAYAGVAPPEASSAGATRHRLNRGGNRRLNAILYRIALTQARSSPDGRPYVQRRMAEGKTWREAIRALKRYLIRATWRRWQECQPPQVAPSATVAA
jgi:transposase